MNNTIKLAVASALLAAASSANAGIMIPAGDWTLDIGGVVNAYYTSTRMSGDFTTLNGAVLGGSNKGNVKTSSNITTGLLPNYLSVSGKTRQNDLDVGFTISINPGASTTHSGFQGSQQENRQAFVTFGDASWGSIKLGKDLGIYASDAILNDMTLLGVGSGAGLLAGNTTTLGRIGTGFMYADWKSQVAYSSPNWNGFNFTAGVTQAWNAIGAGQVSPADQLNDPTLTTGNAFNSATSTGRGGSQPAFEGKASYAWAGDFAGKVWVSGITQKVEGLSTGVAGVTRNDRAEAWDIGANVNVAGFGATAYYGQGSGTGTTVLLRDGFDNAGNQRDSEDWYLQGTYTIPTVGTKLGVSYGESSLDGNGALDTGLGTNTYSNRMWTIGAYHPLTKHLNLVAEYSDVKTEIGAAQGKSKTVDFGAILFF
jgi:predicted porin